MSRLTPGLRLRPRRLITGQVLGYLALVTLTLSLGWVVARQQQTDIPTAAAPEVRLPYVMMQLAYALSSDGATERLTLAPLVDLGGAGGAVGAVGVGVTGSGAELRILAMGLPESPDSAPSAPEYTAVAYRADGSPVPLGALTLMTAQRRWVLSVPLSQRDLPVRRVLVLRRGQPVMQASMESTEGSAVR